MRIVIVAALAILAAGSARAEEIHWAPPTVWETVPLALAGTAMFADALQSLDLKRQGRTEANPLLGKHPSDGQILAGTGVAFVVMAVVWYALPSKLRVGLPLGIFVVEVGQVIENHSIGLRIRM
jgi:hypothetical protein